MPILHIFSPPVWCEDVRFLLLFPYMSPISHTRHHSRGLAFSVPSLKFAHIGQRSYVKLFVSFLGPRLPRVSNGMLHGSSTMSRLRTYKGYNTPPHSTPHTPCSLTLPSLLVLFRDGVRRKCKLRDELLGGQSRPRRGARGSACNFPERWNKYDRNRNDDVNNQS